MVTFSGEQCSASKADLDILAERLASNKNSSPHILEESFVERGGVTKSDDHKLVENIVDERLEAKKCQDHQILKNILLEYLETKKNSDREMFGRVLGELLDARKSDDRRSLERMDEILALIVRALAEIKQILCMHIAKWDQRMFNQHNDTSATPSIPGNQ